MLHDQDDKERRAEESCDNADIDLRRARHEANYDVGDKEERGAGERRWEQKLRRVVMNEGTHELWCHQTDESNRSGDRNGRTDTDGDACDDPEANRPHVDP